uniref:Uncharacterized protein n=1 Tax=Lactuca sativa TaxID=4236 RepID=A0A9R1US16_LACSA|nr:hypothetical protein LSAT_V11C800437620 [Lactuca sativa]
MQQWLCQRRNVGAISKIDVIEYAEKVIDRRINKSSAFQVYQIDQSRYEVTDQMKNGISNLESHYCMCGNEIVFPMPVLAEYEEPDEVMVVLPPLKDK